MAKYKYTKSELESQIRTSLSDLDSMYKQWCANQKESKDILGAHLKEYREQIVKVFSNKKFEDSSVTVVNREQYEKDMEAYNSLSFFKKLFTSKPVLQSRVEHTRGLDKLNKFLGSGEYPKNEFAHLSLSRAYGYVGGYGASSILVTEYTFDDQLYIVAMHYYPIDTRHEILDTLQAMNKLLHSLGNSVEVMLEENEAQIMARLISGDIKREMQEVLASSEERLRILKEKIND